MMAPMITPRMPMPPLLPSAMSVLLQKKNERAPVAIVPMPASAMRNVLCCQWFLQLHIIAACETQ
jgi:hypothetical protein